MWTLWRETLPLRWKVASSLKIIRGKKVLSSKSISQKSVRFLLSPTRRACTSCNLYGFISKRCLNTCQTVTWGMVSSRLAWRVDLRGLRWKASWIQCTFSCEVCGHPGLFPFINTLFLEIIHTNDECSLPVVDQSWNVVEMHATP